MSLSYQSNLVQACQSLSHFSSAALNALLTFQIIFPLLFQKLHQLKYVNPWISCPVKDQCSRYINIYT